ncbi:hypothetical protein PCC7418_2400 [Halothece sp. PCC 7418]|nr:hypothetical protein PCC7418_2400 [Halothece sp. PCC 7418]
MNAIHSDDTVQIPNSVLTASRCELSDWTTPRDQSTRF